MPQISKQPSIANAVPKPRPPAIPPPRDPQTEDEPGMKLSLFGRPKTGKTRLMCSFPKPLLLIGTEDGTKSVKTSRTKKGELKDHAGNVMTMYSLFLRDKPTGIDFVQIYSTASFDYLLETYAKQYKTFGLDHAGGLQDIIVKEVAGLSAIPTQMNWGIIDQQGWGVVANIFKDHMRKFLGFADTYSKHCIVVAHERNFTEGGKADVMLPSVGTALTPTCAGWLSSACDYLGQCYIREQVEVGADDIALKTGKKEFCLRVAPHEVFQTGFRVAEGIDLPVNGIVNPTFAKIYNMIMGK